MQQAGRAQAETHKKMWTDVARRSRAYPRPCHWCGQLFPAGHASFSTRFCNELNEPRQYSCAGCGPRLDTLDLETDRLEWIAGKCKAVSATCSSTQLGHILITLDIRLLTTAFIYGRATNHRDNMILRTNRWIDCGSGFCPICGNSCSTCRCTLDERLLLTHDQWLMAMPNATQRRLLEQHGSHP